MPQVAREAAGWAAGFLAGGVWGVAFFSWGLPLSIPARVAATVLLIAATASAGPAGRLVAGAFALGMGASSSLLAASSGMLLSEWGLVPAAALMVGVGLHAVALVRDPN